MKNHIKLFGLISILSIALLNDSCKKEDDDQSTTTTSSEDYYLNMAIAGNTVRYNTASPSKGSSGDSYSESCQFTSSSTSGSVTMTFSQLFASPPTDSDKDFMYAVSTYNFSTATDTLTHSKSKVHIYYNTGTDDYISYSGDQSKYNLTVSMMKTTNSDPDARYLVKGEFKCMLYSTTNSTDSLEITSADFVGHFGFK
ncbi:hypothetical protein JYU23_01410 [bacterium AH-315-C07]|nr:hypothetical protein [bacterium AH-315-C07]